MSRAQSSMSVEQPAHLEIGQRAHVAQRAGELRLAVLGDAGEPADEPDADVGQRIEVERRPVGRAGELQRRHPARPLDVVDRVVALVEHAGGVHPPLDVLAAVDAGRADVLADRERDRTAGAVDLVGELGAGRRRADHQHAAVGELAGIAVLLRASASRSRAAPRSAQRRHVGDVAGAGREHDASGIASRPGRCATR